MGMRRMLVVVTRHTSRRAAAARARGRCAPVRMSRRRSLDFSVWTQDEQLTSLSSERSAAARHPEKSSHICARVGKVKSSQVKQKTVSDACSEFPKTHAAKGLAINLAIPLDAASFCSWLAQASVSPHLHKKQSSSKGCPSPACCRSCTACN